MDRAFVVDLGVIPCCDFVPGDGDSMERGISGATAPVYNSTTDATSLRLWCSKSCGPVCGREKGMPVCNIVGHKVCATVAQTVGFFPLYALPLFLSCTGLLYFSFYLPTFYQ